MKKSILSILLCITLCLSMAIPGMAAETADAETTDITMQTYSSENDNPETLAIRRGNTFYFQENLTDTTVPDSYSYGKESDEILVGDWDGDGLDTFCMRRGNTYYFSNDLTSETAETEISFGKATDEVLAGDWDGDGIDTLCVRRGNTYYFLNDISESGAMTESFHAKFGNSTDVAYAGDWDGDGIDTLAVCRNKKAYYITNDESMEVSYIIFYGSSTDDGVLVGDWNSDGRDTFCRRVGNTYYFQEYLSDTASRPFETVKFGKSSDSVYAGRWQSDEEYKTVAAVGELAVIASMLGGGGKLLATDEETLSLAASNSVFSDLADAEAVWSGDGSGGLTSDGLARLLELMPDAVVYTSGSDCISESDAETLLAAGINCLVVPAMTSVENIETTVTTMGTILGQSEDGDTCRSKAAEYVSWVDDMLSYVSDATGSEPMYTLYISDWDADAVCTMTRLTTGSVEISETGCAIVENYLCDTTLLMTSLLSNAGITNTASKAYSLSAAKLYTTPLRYSYGPWTVSGSKASSNGFNTSNSKYLEASYTTEAEDGSSDTVTTSLGLSTFPCVIAANSDVQAGILNSKSQTNGQWAVYEHINSADNTFNSDAFLDSAGNMVRTQISADYDVIINPSGLRSWTEGTAESVLETVWAAYAIQGAISESEVRSYISDFYTSFYGYTPTSAEITAILEGTYEFS